VTNKTVNTKDPEIYSAYYGYSEVHECERKKESETVEI